MQAIDTTLTSSLVFRRPLYDVVAVPSSNPKNNKNGASIAKGLMKAEKAYRQLRLLGNVCNRYMYFGFCENQKSKNMKQPMATHGSAYPLH